MKKKPWSIKFIALCFLLAPIGNILQIAYFNHWPYSGPRGVLNHLTNYDWTVLSVFPLVAFGIWRVSRWGYFLCMGFSAYLLLNNTYAMMINDSAQSPYVIFLFQLITLSAAGFFVQRHIAAPYFNPKMKWWETHPRYKVDLIAQLRADQTHKRVHVVDISDGGCFLEVDKDLKLDASLWLHLSVDGMGVNLPARVVWVRHLPIRGYGLMFSSMKKEELQMLNKIIIALRKKPVADPSKKQDSIKSA